LVIAIKIVPSRSAPEIADLLDGGTNGLSNTAQITDGMFRIQHKVGIGGAAWMNVSWFA
jgi:hypothetical protein